MTSRIFALIIDPACPDSEDSIAAIHTDLASLQSLVGGYVEAVYGYRTPDGGHCDDPRITFYLNEEGKIHHMPANHVATALWWSTSPAPPAPTSCTGRW
jgi:hypothetical protein